MLCLAVLAAELLERYEAEDPQGILNRASAYREACVVAGQAAKQREEAQQALDALLAQDENTRKALLELVHPFAPTVKDTFGVSAAISRALQLEERLAASDVLCVFDNVRGADYDRLVKWLSTSYMLGALVTGPVPGILADRFGSYVPAYALFAGCLLCSMALIQGVYYKLGVGKRPSKS